jgi:hypothetical protein
MSQKPKKNPMRIKKQQIHLASEPTAGSFINSFILAIYRVINLK